MKQPDHRPGHTPLTLSMLISETTYRLVVRVERLIHWFRVAILRPLRLMI